MDIQWLGYTRMVYLASIAMHGFMESEPLGDGPGAKCKSCYYKNNILCWISKINICIW